MAKVSDLLDEAALFSLCHVPKSSLRLICLAGLFSEQYLFRRWQVTRVLRDGVDLVGVACYEARGLLMATTKFEVYKGLLL